MECESRYLHEMALYVRSTKKYKICLKYLHAMAFNWKEDKIEKFCLKLQMLFIECDNNNDIEYYYAFCTRDKKNRG